MRIAVITSWFTDVTGGSGTGVFFDSFISGLRDRGHEIEIIVPDLHEKDYVNITLERFLFNARLRTDPRIEVADILIGFDYDGYGLDPQRRPPMIASAHTVFGDIMEWEREPVRTMVHAQAYFERVAMQQAEHVTCGSEYARQRLHELYEIPLKKITAIPHGMIIPRWLELAQAMPPMTHDHPIVLAVGKLYPRKRLDILLRALPALIEQHPDVELRVVGDGLEWEQMRDLATALGIDRHVTWLGHVADDIAYAREWQQADVFCHPSLQETFGYVYLEAMMLGKAIVASRASAGPEVIDGAGVLVEPEESSAMADAIGQLLHDPSRRITLGEQGRARARLYTQSRMIDGYVKIINDLLSGHKISGADA